MGDRKRRETLAMSGRPDLLLAIRIFDGAVLETFDGRKNYGGERWCAIGKVEGHCLVVVFTQRGDRRRIISARSAKPKDTAGHEQALVAARLD